MKLTVGWNYLHSYTNRHYANIRNGSHVSQSHGVHQRSGEAQRYDRAGKSFTVFLQKPDRQSLCHFLHHELSEYHRLLAVLESQMSLTAPNTEEGSHQLAESSGLTLLRLGLWTEEMRLKMKMMVQVVEDVKSV